MKSFNDTEMCDLKIEKRISSRVMTRHEREAWWAGLTPEQRAEEVAKAQVEIDRFDAALKENRGEGGIE